jgi:hypothetical protein
MRAVSCYYDVTEEEVARLEAMILVKKLELTWYEKRTLQAWKDRTLEKWDAKDLKKIIAKGRLPAGEVFAPILGQKNILVYILQFLMVLPGDSGYCKIGMADQARKAVFGQKRDRRRGYHHGDDKERKYFGPHPISLMMGHLAMLAQTCSLFRHIVKEFRGGSLTLAPDIPKWHKVFALEVKQSIIGGKNAKKKEKFKKTLSRYDQYCDSLIQIVWESFSKGKVAWNARGAVSTFTPKKLRGYADYSFDDHNHGRNHGRRGKPAKTAPKAFVMAVVPMSREIGNWSVLQIVCTKFAALRKMATNKKPVSFTHKLREHVAAKWGCGTHPIQISYVQNGDAFIFMIRI